MPKWFFVPSLGIQVPNQSGIYCFMALPARPIRTIQVPNQSGIYCFMALPARPIRTIQVPNQSGIYCSQNVIRS